MDPNVEAFLASLRDALVHKEAEYRETHAVLQQLQARVGQMQNMLLRAEGAILALQEALKVWEVPSKEAEAS